MKKKRNNQGVVKVRIRKSVLVTFLLLIAVVAAVLWGFYEYHRKLDKQMDKYTTENLKEISSESTERITLQVDEYFFELEVLSRILARYPDAGSAEFKELLQNYEEDTEAIWMDFIDGNQKFLIHPEYQELVQGDGFISNFDAYKNVISEVFETEHGKAIAFFLPFFRDQETVGYLVSCYPLESFQTLTSDSVFAKKTSTFIIQRDGTVISRSKGEMTEDTFFDILANMDPEGKNVFKKLEIDIRNGEAGITTYGTGSKKRYITYSQVADGQWYSVSIVSASVIVPYGKYIASLGMNLSYLIIIVYSLFILYLFLRYIWRAGRWYHSYKRSQKR